MRASSISRVLASVDHDLFTNDTEIALTFYDPNEGDSPSEKYGLKLAVPIFVGFIVVALVFTALIMRCSRQEQEYRSSAKKREQGTKREKQVKAILSSTTKDGTTSTETMGDDPIYSYPSGDSDTTGSPTENSNDGLPCMLCSQPQDQSQKTYESNNPKCGHRFHASCMDRWLQIQNTCPLCNEPYVFLA